jgi:hypothetical protein
MHVCPLCRERRGKRPCPARQGSICSACCGAKRLVEIDCPSDCRYLTGAHAAGWDGAQRDHQRDLRRLAPHVQALTETQQKLSLIALVGIAGIRAARRELTDALLHEAVTALRRTAETRSRGIVFEHVPDDARALAIVHDLAEVFRSKDGSGQPLSPDDRDLTAVLGALDAALSATAAEGAGATAFLDTATRLAARLGARPSATIPRVVLS